GRGACPQRREEALTKLLENVLVIFKKSLYQIYFMEKREQVADSANRFDGADLERYHAAHETHTHALHDVCRTLDGHGIPYRLIYRARQVDYSAYSLVIAVGGDGTFIEAARRVTDLPILGVNSDPERSVGVFCTACRETFPDCLRQLMAGEMYTRGFNRMEFAINDKVSEYRVLNEILVAHQSPAAMSRYRLCGGDVEESQRSSGVWVCTAAGSTGAMRSAGGKRMPPGSVRLQYRPRELYRAPDRVHHYR